MVALANSELATLADSLEALAACGMRDSYLEASCGLAHLSVGDLASAHRWLRSAADIAADNPAILHNLGAVELCLGLAGTAESRFRAALAIAPASAASRAGLGEALAAQQRLEEAIVALEQARELGAQDSRLLATLASALRSACAWEASEEVIAALRCAVEEDLATGALPGLSPLAALILFQAPPLHLAIARAHSNAAAVKLPAQPRPPPVARQRRRPIRLAYLSPDLGDHPVGRLLSSVIEHHRRERFEIFTVQIGPDRTDATAERIASAGHQHWRLAGASPSAIATALDRLQLDILVDLAGHTAHAQPELFTRRTAPVQINWMGYPGSMGVDGYDFIIADRHIIPADMEEHYAEKVLRLPRWYLPLDAALQPAADPGDHRMPPDRPIIFCCFAQSDKITQSQFLCWMQVLAAVPGGQLWLSQAPPLAQANLRREAAAAGVDPDRLVFGPRLATHKQHLDRLARADLYLDTYPYNAHSAAGDAILAGLPLVTLMGSAFASRVAGSLLLHLGMPELATSTPGEYTAAAINAATQTDYRHRLRRRLLDERLKTDQFCPRVFCRDLEDCLLQALD